jgi:hypothetical protein
LDFTSREDFVQFCPYSNGRKKAPESCFSEAEDGRTAVEFTPVKTEPTAGHFFCSSPQSKKPKATKGFNYRRNTVLTPSRFPQEYLQEYK